MQWVEHGALLGQKRSAEGPGLAQVGDILVVEAAGEDDDGRLDFGDWGVGGRELVVEVAHLGDAPEQVDRRGAGLGQGVADEIDFFAEVGQIRGGGAVDAEGNAHGGRDTDGHGPADDHVLDDAGDLAVVGGEDVGLLKGELGLVEEINAFREPFEGRDHVAPVYQ